MRMILVLTGACVAVGSLALVSGASAAPLPSIASLDAGSTAVQQVDWRRRYYRRNGVWPPVSVPRAAVEEGVIVDEDVVVLPNEPVVRIIPARPVSCGEFHYWDGERCVDARFHDPYTGPR